MFVIPAIDIKGGKCVRLLQGDFSKVTTYSDDPLKVAQAFAKDRAQLMNVIDLDGAKNGATVNKDLILKIVQAVSVPVQVGGGIRSYQDAKDYLDGGVRRVILSTAAIEDPSLVKQLVEDFGNECLVVAADIKNGEFATNGWTKSGGKTAKRSIELLKGLGIKYVLVTDVSKDGTLKGPNFGLMQQFIDGGLQTIAAGGIASLADIVELNKRGAYGAVVGKAVYEGSVDITKAQKAVAYTNNLAKRIVPCLDIKDGRVSKGVQFKDHRDAGDPVSLARRYTQEGADELVFYDITASADGRDITIELVRKIAREISIPFTVGGGIRSVEDMRRILLAGADKVSINTAALENPELITQGAAMFGSQCIVVGIDSMYESGEDRIYSRTGRVETRQETGRDTLEWIKEAQDRGAGEITLNTMKTDGMKRGYDLRLLKKVSSFLRIPLVASGGAGNVQHFVDAFEIGGADAALAASVFHFGEISIGEVKAGLKASNIPVRL